MASQLRASRVPIIAIYLLLLGLFLFVFLHSFAGKAYAANPQLINFQGKVVNSDGTNVSNGNYDFDFILYDDPTAGTNRWQEGWTSGTSQVTVTNGIFRVALGTHVALPNFNTYPNLYLAVKFNNDAAGYMTPRVRLTSVPYALNSDAVGGLGAANFVQLAQGVQTDASTANPSIGINKTGGTANILQLQKSGADVMVIANAGAVTFKNQTDSATAFVVQNATAADTLLTVNTDTRANGGGIVKIGNNTGADTNTTILVVDSALSNPTTNLSALNGGLFYNSTNNKVSIIENGAVKVLCNTTDAGCGAGGSTTLQQAYDNSSSPATITTSSTTKDVIVKSGSGFNADSMFQVQDAGGSEIFAVDTTDSNLVTNGSLETNTTGWTALTGNTAGDPTLSQSTAQSHIGRASLSIATNADSNEGAKFAYVLDITTYTLSFFAKLSSGTFSTLTAGYSEDGSTLTDCLTGQTVVTGGWTRFTCQFTTTSTGPSAHVYVRQSDATSRTFFIDAVQLKAASSSSPYREGGLYLNGIIASPIALQNTSNSTEAFQVANAAGTSLLTINTLDTTVTIDANTALSANRSLRLAGGNTASRPGSPSAGTLYYDTTTNQILQYNGTKWVSDRTPNTKIVAASNSSQAAKDAADYIADGTGDQTEINAALTAVTTDLDLGAGTSNTNGIVYLMEGTYVANATITMPNNTTLAGAGRGTLIELADIDTTDNLIENSDTSTGTGVVIKDLRLDGRSDSNTVGTQHGIHLNGMGASTGAGARQGSKLMNLWISRFRDRAISLTSSSNNIITGNTTQGNGLGITLLSSSNNNDITSNNAQGNTTAGIYINTVSNNVSGNTAQGNTGAGIYLDTSASGTSVTGNAAYGNGGAGVYVGAGLNTISGNNFNQNTYGVHLNAASANTITGNGFVANTSYGIYVAASSHNNSLTGNTITSSAQGIAIDTSNNNVVSGNKVHDSGSASNNNGIHLSAADFSSITSNNITDTACTTNCYAINISNSTSDKNYLEGNRFSGSAANAASINDTGTNTIYVNQQTNTTTSTDSNVSDFRFRGSTDSATAFQVQTAGGTSLLSVDTSTVSLAINASLSVAPTANNVGTIIKQTSGTATSGNVFDVQTANGSSSFIQITNAAANEGAVTVQSIGATRTLALNSGSGTITTTASTLQKSGNALAIDLATAATSTLTVTNSDGSNVANLSVEGGIDIGSGQTYKVGGSQISSANLSNDASLAKLSANQTFTGTNTFQPTTDITSVVIKQTSAGSPTADIFNLQNVSSANFIQATSAGALQLASLTSQALTITAAAASTWSTSTGNLTLQGGSALILDANASSSIRIGDATNNLTLSATTRELVLAGSARHTRILVISPEYPGATMSRDGSSTYTGSMTSDNSFSGSAWRNYYEWTSTQASNQDYTIMVRFTLPSDFDGWATGSCPGSTCALEIDYQTGLAATTNNGVSVLVNNSSDTPGTAVCTISEAASTSWTSFGCAESTLNDASAPEWDAAGETAVIRIKVKANSTASALARAGDITIRYLSKW